jgi:hypothetical protein
VRPGGRPSGEFCMEQGVRCSQSLAWRHGHQGGRHRR